MLSFLPLWKSVFAQLCPVLVPLCCKEVETIFSTGKSLSEALLFEKHGENMLCTEIVLNVKNNFCIQHLLPMFRIFMYWTCNSMNNLSSYFGLVDAKVRASDKDLPVTCVYILPRNIFILCLVVNLTWKVFLLWETSAESDFLMNKFSLCIGILVWVQAGTS